MKKLLYWVYIKEHREKTALMHTCILYQGEDPNPAKLTNVTACLDVSSEPSIGFDTPGKFMLGIERAPLPSWLPKRWRRCRPYDGKTFSRSCA